MNAHRFAPLALALSVLTLALSTRADSLADRVPADAIGYMSWSGSDALGNAYDTSHFKILLDTLNLPQFISRQIDNNLQKNAGDPQKQADIKLLQDLLAAAAKAPTAAYFGPMDFADAQHPTPRIALFSKLGREKAADLAERLTVSINRHKNDKKNQPPSSATVVGDYLLVSIGAPTDIDQRLAAMTPADGLSSVPAFKDALAQVGAATAPPAVLLYVNGDSLLKLIDDAVSVRADPPTRNLWPKMEDALGFNQVHQLVWAGNFDNADWSDQAFIALDAHRSGLTALYDNKPFADDTLKLIPKSATWAGVLRFDGGRLLDDLRDSFAHADEQNGARNFDRGLQQFFAITGVDLRKEILDSLGDSFVYYGSPDSAGHSLHNATLINKLKDSPTAETAFTALESFINAMIAQRNPNSTVQFKTESLAAPSDKVTAHILTLANASPAWTINNGLFFVSASTAALQNAVDNAGKNESILDNPQFVELRKKLGPVQFSSFSYIDLPKAAPEAYAMANQFIEHAHAANPDQKNPFSLPPLNNITPALSPTLSIYWSDKNGFHAKSIGPFPGCNMLSPENLLLQRMNARNTAQRQAPPQKDLP